MDLGLGPAFPESAGESGSSASGDDDDDCRGGANGGRSSTIVMPSSSPQSIIQPAGIPPERPAAIAEAPAQPFAAPVSSRQPPTNRLLPAPATTGVRRPPRATAPGHTSHTATGGAPPLLVRCSREMPAAPASSRRQVMGTAQQGVSNAKVPVATYRGRPSAMADIVQPAEGEKMPVGPAVAGDHGGGVMVTRSGRRTKPIPTFTSILEEDESAEEVPSVQSSSCSLDESADSGSEFGAPLKPRGVGQVPKKTETRRNLSDGSDDDWFFPNMETEAGKIRSVRTVAAAASPRASTRARKQLVDIKDLLDASSSDSGDTDGEGVSDANPDFDDPLSHAAIDKVVEHRNWDAANPEDREFWIKWQDRSHLHNTWESWRRLQCSGCPGFRRLENYVKRVSERETRWRAMTEDAVEQEQICLELTRQLDADARIPERIVAKKTVNVRRLALKLREMSPVDAMMMVSRSPSILDALRSGEAHSLDSVEENSLTAAAGVTGNIPSLSVRREEFFVRWTSQQYDCCTWESEKTLRDAGCESLLQEYAASESRLSGELSAYHPLNSHDLSETSFEPYTVTPEFLGVSSLRIWTRSQPKPPPEGAASAAEVSIKEEQKLPASPHTSVKPPSVAGNTGSAGNSRPPCELREYQLIGINWIVSRMKKSVSVLLADEMGLGKTVQSIGVIGHMMYQEFLAGPFLVIVPQSTMDNWYSEFCRWLPDAKVVLFHGNRASRETIQMYEMSQVSSAPLNSVGFSRIVGRRPTTRLRYNFDVLIVTPSVMTNAEDMDLLRSLDFYLMVVDEAHSLKNRDSKRFREARDVSVRYKLLLSGTPLHNNLEEMWSLLHFMNPTIYDNVQRFQAEYSEVEKPESIGSLKQRQLEELRKQLSSVVLRRVKRDVLKSLPSKVERILRVELSPAQTELYRMVYLRNYSELIRATGGKTAMQNICMEMKKVCNHPYLLSMPDAREAYPSSKMTYCCGKLVLLEQLLQRLREKGSRVLIFSQMVRMLNLLSDWLTMKGWRHQRLDGTMVKEVRKKAMDAFNAPDSEDFVFLLSTKAGGLGINLTSADTVIIYDSDWNPQNDLQAEARAHRIGQTKTVQIYRLISKESIEVSILERARQKMVLDTLVVQGLNAKQGEGGAMGSTTPAQVGFSRDDLAKILRFGADRIWDKSKSNDQPPDVNLDQVLAEAEECAEKDDPSDTASQLVSSYTNVSDFRYVAPTTKQKSESDVKDPKAFWDAVIPQNELRKFQEGQVSEAIVKGKRRRQKPSESSQKKEQISPIESPRKRAKTLPETQTPNESKRGDPRKRRRQLPLDASGKTSESTKSARGNNASQPAKIRKSHLSEKARHNLHRALLKFGHPRNCQECQEFTRHSSLPAEDIIAEAEWMLDQCRSLLRKRTSRSDRHADDEPRRISLPLGGGNQCNCQELVDRVDQLAALHRLVRAGGEKVSAEKLRLPAATWTYVKLPNWDEEWTETADAALLLGIYIHGFGEWQAIAADVSLSEMAPCISQVRIGLLKSRAMRLLKFLDDFSKKRRNGRLGGESDAQTEDTTRRGKPSSIADPPPAKKSSRAAESMRKTSDRSSKRLRGTMSEHNKSEKTTKDADGSTEDAPCSSGDDDRALVIPHGEARRQSPEKIPKRKKAEPPPVQLEPRPDEIAGAGGEEPEALDGESSFADSALLDSPITEAPPSPMSEMSKPADPSSPSSRPESTSRSRVADSQLSSCGNVGKASAGDLTGEVPGRPRVDSEASAISSTSCMSCDDGGDNG